MLDTDTSIKTSLWYTLVNYQPNHCLGKGYTSDDLLFQYKHSKQGHGEFTGQEHLVSIHCLSKGAICYSNSTDTWTKTICLGKG